MPMRAKSRQPQIPVVWSGPAFNSSGIALESRKFVMNMARDIPVYLRPAGNYDEGFVSGMDRYEFKALASRVKLPDSPYISVLNMPAYAFEKDPKALYNVGRTIFETDRLSPEWVSRCNLMDEVWVPTEFNAASFRKSGVTVPLFIIPDGIDYNFYRPGFHPVPVPGRRGFAFLSIFEWTYRKGWDVLLKAWAESFTPGDDVCLVLRSDHVRGTGPDVESRVVNFLRSIGRSKNDVAPIIILRERVPELRMPALYAAVDAFVLPSRGEGWGHPYMQAMSCGIPVIGTRWGGSLDFMNEQNAYLIATKGLEPVDERMELPFYKGHLWADPSTEHTSFLMKHVFSNRLEAKRKAQKARQDIESLWSWKKGAGLAAARIREISSNLLRPAAATVRNTTKAGTNSSFCVRWEGLQFAWHSLALINRELCLKLIDGGHEVSIMKFVPEEFGAEEDPRFHKIADRVGAHLSRPADVHVRHHFPPDFNPPPEGRWVMIQPWEYGRLPVEWVGPMSMLVDEIWVPSSYVMQSYIASGVPSDRVKVVPNGVNTAIFNPQAKPWPVPTIKKFKFLFVGGLIWRKGLDVLLQAYRSAFSKTDDVTLVIKEIGKSNFYQGMGSDRLIRQIQNDPRAPEVIHITQMLTEKQMAGLFTGCDCLVHSYRGEGFALPVIEAMACGLPVAVTEGGATDDFCSRDTAFLIPAKHNEFFHKRIKFAGGPGWVLEPDPAALAEILRHVRSRPEDAAAKALRALDQARTKYSWDAVAKHLFKRIDALRSKPIRRSGRCRA